jgi:hypothetical protein
MDIQQTHVRDHYLLLCDVTADTENTASSTVTCWTVFTELLPGNALIKSIGKYGLTNFYFRGAH